MVYPYMECKPYAYLASTYRPPELGSAEIDILYSFVEGSQSAYDILKKKRQEDRVTEKRTNYKDVHKRVKRLEELKLIASMPSQTNRYFERGAKHYSLTPYGLITSLDKVLSYDHRHILYNKHNIAIRALLSDLFEIDTIDSFDLLKDFPGINLERYLHDCCSITSDICRGFWTGIQRYNLTNILPSDEIIQRYMVHLDWRSNRSACFGRN